MEIVSFIKCRYLRNLELSICLDATNLTLAVLPSFVIFPFVTNEIVRNEIKKVWPSIF